MKKYLIVGLGNVGNSYYDTRHNIGFDIVNQFAKKYDKDFDIKRYGSICELKIKSHTIILLKPSTYMNLSGNAVNYYLKKYRIPIQNLLIISDDLDLEFCQIKIKQKGGDGGHNGHKNIIHVLNTNTYARLRFGIGNAFNRGEQINYVLGKWSDLEKEKIEEKIPFTYDMIVCFVQKGIENTMNTFN